MIISLINVIYNLIESVQSVFITKVFLGSIYIFFIPYNRYINNDNVFELLILFLLFVISFMVLFFSAKELLNNKNIKYPFTIANILWFDFILIIPLLIVSSHDKDFLEYFSCSNFIYGYLSIFIMILQIIVMIMKSFNYYRMVKNNSILAKEEFLFETFSWHAKSYKQIKRTALGIPVITILTFFFSLLLEYINTEKSIILIDFLYTPVSKFLKSKSAYRPKEAKENTFFENIQSVPKVVKNNSCQTVMPITKRDCCGLLCDKAENVLS